MVVHNPFVAPVNNSVHLGMIRAVHGLGWPSIDGDRMVNAAAYVGGLLLLGERARSGWRGANSLPSC